MRWRFTILARNNVATVIDEPVGWDAALCEIIRDLTTHGIFFTTSGQNFEFYDEAKDLLKTENDLFGVQGQMILLIEEKCSDEGDEYTEFARGKFIFAKYEFYCGDGCYVKMPVENTNEVMNLRNRINQKVNIEATKAFDETTDLVPYAKLPFVMELPSKAILLKDHSLNEASVSTDFNGTVVPAFTEDCEFNVGIHNLQFAFTKQASAEVGNYSFLAESHLLTEVGSSGEGETIEPNILRSTCALPSGLNPLFITEIINFSKETPNYGQISDLSQLEFRFKGIISTLNCYLGNIVFYFLRLPDRPGDANNGDNESDYDFLYEESIHCRVPQPPGENCPTFPGAEYIPPGQDIPFDIIFSDPAFVLNKGDRIYVTMAIEERKSQAQIDAILGSYTIHSFNVTTDNDSYFKLSNLSKTPASNSSVFAINEAISRVVESITNDGLRMYSEYFGRTDSQPYSVAEDGCGSLEVIADGIRIRRQENKTPGQKSVFSLSLQDMFNGLNPIHNIGYGIEPDPNRAGYNRLRMEPWKYFYNDNIILSCTGINKISRKTNEKEIYSTFQAGYAKWEAEEYTGLDEFLTKRNYRTTLSAVKNDLIKLSEWIASGYALEITRRKGNDNSKDWRYDKNTFIICCKREDENGIIVELGNVSSPENIIDPPTLYNYRISPIRNAMRWMNRVLASYRTFDSESKIIFTDGDGNYFAKGEMTSADCKLENGVIAENQTIDPSIYADQDAARPFLMPERVAFDYPMSGKDYKLIEANPNGLIYFENFCEEGFGWIDNISYKPEAGIASFTLIPKQA